MTGHKKRCATIDRFEGDFAVLIAGDETMTVPRSQLASDAREGDVVDVATGSVDAQATQRLRDEVRAAGEKAFRGRHSDDDEL
jgi:hypothetical protein